MKTVKELVEKTRNLVAIGQDGSLTVKNEQGLRTAMDDIVRGAVFGDDDTKASARWLIRAVAQKLGSVPASIQSYYEARSKGKYARTSVPAINIRGMAYDFARAIFRAANKKEVGAVIIELAASESTYTSQRPSEFAPVVLAAAVRESFNSPVFIQGDHYQVKMKKYLEDPKKELESIKKFVKESVESGYFNIDIDTSTTVLIDKPTLDEQQFNNSLLTAQLTAYIREIQPNGVTVSVGGEIGEIGKKNSNPDEVKAYMAGVRRELDKIKPGLAGPSKISVQTGTSHGGTVKADGSIAEVNLDFGALKACGETAKKEFGMGGAVQHGASTLPADMFHKFPEVGTLEVHLATDFQNTQFENKFLPADVKNKIYDYIRTNFGDERKKDWTEEQFIYKTRKKGFGGPLKEVWWNLDAKVRDGISGELQEKFEFLFEQLNATKTVGDIKETVKPVAVNVPMPATLKAAL
jgi:fructose/tagatose bisphosphate aldolase